MREMMRYQAIRNSHRTGTLIEQHEIVIRNTGIPPKNNLLFNRNGVK